MPKAYFTVKNYGIKLNAYAVRNQAFMWKIDNENVQKLIKKSKEDPSFYVIVTSDKWHQIMWERKEFVKNVQDTEKVKKYFEYVRNIFKNLSYFNHSVINFEPDPMGSFYKTISKNYNSDPTKVYVPLDKIDLPEIKELNPPNNFAGFWQVIDYMRKKYSPQTKIAPTIKTWGTSGKPAIEPEGGWTYDNPQVKPMWEYYARYWVDWDWLAFNFNATSRNDKEFKSILKYFSAVADWMSKKFNKPIYRFIWKVKIFDFYYKQTTDKWDVNELQFLFKNIPFMASLWIRWMVVWYWSELSDKYTSNKGELPSALVCWLKEYYLWKNFSCTPQGTIGLQKVEIK